MTKKQKILCAAITCAVIIAAVVLVSVLSHVDRTAGSSGVGLTFDPNSGIYTPEINDADEAEHSGIAIPGWDHIEIEADKTDVNVNLINPEDNADRYYMKFTIYLDGESEPLAETGLVRGGESALELHLTHPLSAGEYPATVHIQPYRVQDSTPTNNADIELMLIVK